MLQGQRENSSQGKAKKKEFTSQKKRISSQNMKKTRKESQTSINPRVFRSQSKKSQRKKSQRVQLSTKPLQRLRKSSLKSAKLKRKPRSTKSSSTCNHSPRALLKNSSQLLLEWSLRLPKSSKCQEETSALKMLKTKLNTSKTSNASKSMAPISHSKSDD